MLTVEQNERLTRVGQGTPMGELMRRYWQPVAPADQLLANPVRKVRILGEDLVLFRDRSGGLGLIGDRCAHRRVNLEFGIPEDCGLRCPYHGWLYDRSGQCIETPLEPTKSRFREHIKLPGYPVQEFAGLIWAYLGPEPAPLLPPWDLFVWPGAIRQVGFTVIPCNWLQCQENAADPVHSVYLHGHFFKYVLERQGLLETRAADTEHHRAHTSMRAAQGFDRVISKIDAYGLRKAMVYSAARGAAKDSERWHSYMIFPNYTRPGGGAGVRHEFQIRVPMDDTHTYHINYGMYAAPPGVEVPAQEVIPSYEIPMYDENGHLLLDFVLAQDMAAWWSQGDITDRSQENLGVTDEAIVRFRRLLEEQLAVVEAGGDPMNVFRDPTSLPDIIHLPPRVDERWGTDGPGSLGVFRNFYHKGFAIDDADRYGPLTGQAADFMRQIEEFESPDAVPASSAGTDPESATSR